MWAPVIDLAYFAPHEMEKYWDDLTAFLWDCDINTENIAEIKDKIMYPDHEDYHADILIFLEET